MKLELWAFFILLFLERGLLDIKQIQESRRHWHRKFECGYFINDNGNVICHPTGEEHLFIDLPGQLTQARLLIP